jgi:hypothetical protein
VIAFGGLLVVSAGAQHRPSLPTAAQKGTASQKTEPCWEQAGISKSVMEQRKSILQSTRSQVEAVCSETNLSEQQKREKIHEIRQAAQEKINAMISSGERQQLEACQRAHQPTSPHPTGHPASSDPCAGLGR